MNSLNYGQVARERWLIILAGILVGLTVAATAFLVRPIQYTAATQVYVSAQLGSSPQQAFQGAQLSEQRVQSYLEIAVSDRVLDSTIELLNLPESAQQLAAKVNASSATDSVIIDIAVTDQSPTRAAAMADSVARFTSETVSELERPADPLLGPGPVQVRQIQPAKLPTEPTSSTLPTNLLVGLVAGAAVGFAAAVVRHRSDNSVKSDAQLAAVAEASILSVTSVDDKHGTDALVLRRDGSSAQAEAYRRLRANIQFVDIDSPQKTLLFTSSVDGEGKTTTVANLALAMASAGHRVLVIEADLRRPQLSTMLGLDRSVGLTTVLAGGSTLRSAIQQWGGMFSVLSSGATPPNPSELLSSSQMKLLLSDCKKQYDAILIDTPPVLPVTDALSLAPAVDGVVLICRYKRVREPQVRATAAALRGVSARVFGSVLTVMPERTLRASGVYGSYYQNSTRVDSHYSLEKRREIYGRESAKDSTSSQIAPNSAKKWQG